MATTANVNSIEAIKEFKIAFCKQTEDARLALDNMRVAIKKFVYWLEVEQVEYWKMQVKIREKDLSQAKADLSRKRMSGGKEKPDCTVETLALRRAESKLQEAEGKLRLIAKWSKVVDQAIQKYDGQHRRLYHTVTNDARMSIHLLDGMIDSLDAYVRLAAPTTGRETPLGAAAGS